MAMTRMIFQVPLPVERLASGWGCRGLPGEDVLGSTAERLGGVANVQGDQPAGRVAMRDDPERLDSAQRVPAFARASEPVRGQPVNPLA